MEDGKKPPLPRLPAITGHDRDQRRIHTPPQGVANQLASESWEDDHTGQTPVEYRSAVETPIETITRRTAETKNTSLTTLERVDTLQKRVETVESKIDTIQNKLEVHGEQNSAIISMTGNVIEMLKQSHTVTTTTELEKVKVTTARDLTDNELRKEKELAQIQEKKLRSELRTEFWKKVLMIVGAVAIPIAGVLAAYLKGC